MRVPVAEAYTCDSKPVSAVSVLLACSGKRSRYLKKSSTPAASWLFSLPVISQAWKLLPAGSLLLLCASGGPAMKISECARQAKEFCLSVTLALLLLLLVCPAGLNVTCMLCLAPVHTATSPQRGLAGTSMPEQGCSRQGASLLEMWADRQHLGTELKQSVS